MNREGWLAVVGLGALALVACGSSSKENFDEGDGGEAGTTSGGTSQGGSSGTSGSSTGGSSTGGSSTGGSSTGGSSTGGASGSSPGGASGSGGTGGMRGYRPPDCQIQGCMQMCELEAAAMCPAEDTVEKCVEGCRVGIQFEACSGDWDALFACAGTASPAVCNAQGQAVVADCVAEGNAAVGCVVGVSTASDLTAQCAAHCAAAAGAMCPNGGSVDGCGFNCRVLATAFPVCSTLFESYLTCSADADQTCDADGEPSPAGCLGAFGTFADCLTAEYGWEV